MISDPDFSYCYPAELGRKIARRYVMLEGGKGMAILLAVAVYGIVNLIYGSAHWVFGGLAVAGLGYNFLWLKYYGEIVRAYQRRAGKLVRVTLSENALNMELEHVKVAIGWPAFTECWRMRDALVLFTDERRSSYVPLPLGTMTDEQRGFIQARLLEHKVRIA